MGQKQTSIITETWQTIEHVHGPQSLLVVDRVQGPTMPHVKKNMGRYHCLSVCVGTKREHTDMY
jgi:hypothetical protein